MRRKTAARIALVASLLVMACATGTQTLVRDDWVVAPTQSGREVLLRSEYLKQRRARGQRASNLETIPPPLLKAGSGIALHVGEVKTFLLEDEPVRAIATHGGAARLFWSKPYQIDRMENGHLAEHKGADLHIAGLQPGVVEVELELATGERRQVRVEVLPARASVRS